LPLVPPYFDGKAITKGLSNETSPRLLAVSPPDWNLYCSDDYLLLWFGKSLYTDLIRNLLIS
jgi:hypothetical protein